MKKIFVSLILAGLFSFVSATAPTYTNPNVYTSALALNVTTKDTIVSATDSQIVSSAFDPEPLYNYYLTNGTFTGGATDSVDLDITVQCFDKDGNKLYTYVLDSIQTPGCKPTLLPFDNGLFGTTFKIYLKGSTSVGGELITNGWQIWKQRPIGIDKKTW